jgi:hypothetical protein
LYNIDVVYWVTFKEGEYKMSQTRAQRLKQQRRLTKRRNKRKMANIKKAISPEKYRLDVLLDGVWRTGVKYYRRWEDVEAHRDKTEGQRRAGETIAAGRVYNLETGKLILEIVASEQVPVKGSLPDVLADKSETSVKKSFLERAKELIKGSK